jgi:hypothetical protein
LIAARTARFTDKWDLQTLREFDSRDTCGIAAKGN